VSTCLLFLRGGVHELRNLQLRFAASFPAARMQLRYIAFKIIIREKADQNLSCAEKVQNFA
jgi:hypothetical protein